MCTFLSIVKFKSSFWRHKCVPVQLELKGTVAFVQQWRFFGLYHFWQVFQVQKHYCSIAAVCYLKKKILPWKNSLEFIFPSTVYPCVTILAFPVLIFNVKSEFYLQTQYSAHCAVLSKWSAHVVHRKNQTTTTAEARINLQPHKRHCVRICTCCCSSDSSSTLLQLHRLAQRCISTFNKWFTTQADISVY